MVTPERFAEVLRNNEGKLFGLGVGVNQVSVLHGLIALAMDHPGMQELSEASKVAQRIRDWCLQCFRSMGFSDEEVAQLDTMREEKDTNELRLGPRTIVLRGKSVGTCDDLSFTIAEATEEEIEELRGANEIRLVRMAEG